MEWRPSGTSCRRRDIVCRSPFAPFDKCTEGRSFFFTADVALLSHNEQTKAKQSTTQRFSGFVPGEKWTQRNKCPDVFLSHFHFYPNVRMRKLSTSPPLTAKTKIFKSRETRKLTNCRRRLWLLFDFSSSSTKNTFTRNNPNQTKSQPKVFFRKSVSINQQNNNKKARIKITIVTVKCGSERAQEWRECYSS